MEKTVVVVLLLCALSWAEESKSVAQSQPYPSYLYNDLLEIRVKLAEDRLMIEQLQKDKEELEAKVKELEDQECDLKPIKDQIEEHEDKLKELQALTTQVDTVKKQKKVRQVAFFATLLGSGGAYFGKYTTQTLLIFRNVILNVADAYSPSTGFFTAPVDGVYHFDVTIYGSMDKSHPSAGAVLVKDGKNVVITYQYQATGAGTTPMSATLLLEAGSVVAVHLWAHTRIYDNYNNHCTFSGHLLFTTGET